MADLSPLQMVEEIEHGLRMHDFNRQDLAKHMRCISLIDLLVEHFCDCDNATWEVIQLRTYSDSVFTTHRDSIVKVDFELDRKVALACCRNLKQMIKEQPAQAVA
jgi:hypothetical protein